MRPSLRSKSFLISSKQEFLTFREKKIVKKKSTFLNLEEPAIDSLKSIPNIPEFEAKENNPTPSSSSSKSNSLSKRNSKLGDFEQVYNFNKTLSVKNAIKIEKLTLPTISPPPSSQKLKESLILSPLFSKRRESTMTNSSSSALLRKRNAKIFTVEESFLDTLKRILKKQYNERTEDDIKLLVKLLSQISFFQTLGVQNEQNIIEKCCNYFNIEFANKGSYVFLYGSQGTKFYVILQGSVGVMVPKFGNFTKKDDFLEIKILKTGESFGELALISKKPRSASILCKEDCYFAVLDKKYFFEILLDFEEKKLQTSLDFLRNYKMFKSWTSAQLTSVFLATQESRFLRNHVVFKQGEQNFLLFFVKSGEFIYQKEINYFDWERYQEFPYLPNVLKDNFAFRRSQKMNITIAKFGEGSLIGEETIFLNKECEHSLVCSSNEGVLMILNKNDLFHRWNLDNFKASLDELKKECTIKEQKYQRRFEDYLSFLKKKNEILPEKSIDDERIIENKKSLPLLKRSKPKSISFSQDHLLKLKLVNDSSANSLTVENWGTERPKKNQLKETIVKFNRCKYMKGLSQKRSNTLMIKIIDDYETIKDSYQTERDKKENSVSKIQYSLTKRNNLDISDPYCLISILDPKIKTQMQSISERCKLLKKKLSK